MIICKNCGVELEPDMEYCPLCEEPVKDGFKVKLKEEKEKDTEKPGWTKQTSPYKKIMSHPQRKATWELVFFILILISIITSLLNYILNKEISWSQYPVAVCMIIFSYISFFAFLHTRTEIQFFFGFISASALILLLDFITGRENWSLRLAIPLLLFTNIVIILLIKIIHFSKQRGINLIAYSFLAAALLCISIEVIVDLYINNQISLTWSLIVSACVLPISLVLLFMHYRLKKGTDLNKTFHI